jgi:hypothetical protein
MLVEFIVETVVLPALVDLVLVDLDVLPDLVEGVLAVADLLQVEVVLV